ncbi:MAG: radical SAM protein [Desulfobacterales bacterium]|nr:radical SAM protein [Desulfobacterales bacterium]
MNPDSSEKFKAPGFWESLREAFLGAPRTFACLQVEVTSRCPARCNYCPHTTLKDVWQPRDMSLETFGRLWPAMRASARVHLQGWGEPLMNPAFFKMTAIARKAGCRVSTTTCGLHLNEELARKIVDSGIDIIAFSLAGTDAATNEVRRGADFEKVCRSIATLQNIRRARGGVHLEVHFAYLMLASTMESVRTLPALAKELGVHAAVVSTLDYIPASGFEKEAFGPHEAEKLAQATGWLKEAEAKARALEVDFHWSLPSPDAPGNECRENVSRCFYIAADGAVSPCVYLNLPVRMEDPGRRIFGNVNEREVLEIWADERFLAFRKALASGAPDPACKSCPKRFMAG